MKIATAFYLAIVMSLCATTARALRGGETMDSIQDAIEEKCGKHTSISYRIESVTAYKDSKTVMTGVYDAALVDGKWKRRTETRIVNGLTSGPDGQPLNRITIMLDDGVNYYKFENNAGDATATKQATLGKDECKSVEEVLGDLRAGNDVEFLPDEKIDGQPVYVLSIISKNKALKQRASVSKETGVVLRLEMVIGGTFEMTTTVTVKDFKLDAPIAPERFVFTPPNGIVVRDITPKIKSK